MIRLKEWTVASLSLRRGRGLVVVGPLGIGMQKKQKEEYFGVVSLFAWQYCIFGAG